MEKEEIKNLAEEKGLTISEYIRRVAAKPPAITRKEYNDEIARAIYEIHKIGVNINQIAKKYNENEFKEPSDYLISRLELVYSQAANLRKLMKTKK